MKTATANNMIYITDKLDLFGCFVILICNNFAFHAMSSRFTNDKDINMTSDK